MKRISVPAAVVLIIFVGALGAMTTWALADSEKQNERLATQETATALLSQSVETLTATIETLNDNLKTMNGHAKTVKEDKELKTLIRKFLEVEKSKPTKEK